MQDAASLGIGGNAVLNAKYMGNHTQRDLPIPDGNDLTKLKEFIKFKYTEVYYYYLYNI